MVRNGGYMIARLLLLLLVSLACLLVGCSEEQKKDAAALEQELLEREDTAASGAAESTEATELEAEPMDVAAVPEEPEPEPIPTGASGTGWSVQVAACEDADYAEHLIERYQSRGYSPYLTTFTHNGQMYYRVRLGVFDTQEEARRVRLELIDKYSVDSWVTFES